MPGKARPERRAGVALGRGGGLTPAAAPGSGALGGQADLARDADSMGEGTHGLGMPAGGLVPVAGESPKPGRDRVFDGRALPLQFPELHSTPLL